jgi:hypothetical protein
MTALAVFQGRSSRASQTARSFWSPARCRFVIDNRPTRFAGAPHLSDGDRVTVVGYDWREFVALAMRNDSTGVEYRPPVASLVAGAIAALAIGAGTAALVAYTMSRLTGQLAGFPLFMGSFMAMPMLIGGVGLLYNARRNANANHTLSRTPALSAAQAAAQPILAAPTDQADSVPLSLARIFVGVVGMLLVIVAALATAATISLAAGEWGPVDTIFGLVLSVGVGSGGFALVRWGLGPRRRVA